MPDLVFAFQVIATLAYSNQFDWSLSFDELNQRLISKELAAGLIKKYGKNVDIVFGFSHAEERSLFSLSADDLKKVLNRLIKFGLVTEYQGEYFLTVGLQKLGGKSALPELVEQKHQRQKKAKQLKQELFLVQQKLKCVPWIIAAGVTGSLAVGNLDLEGDADLKGSVDLDHSPFDLDFMIIAEDNRLWLARLYLLLISILSGKKTLSSFLKKNNKKDEWCFNLWLEQGSLSLSGSRHSIYSAYEIMQIEWFFGPQSLSKLFLQKNQWVSEFLAEADSGQRQHKNIKSQGSLSHSRNFFNWLSSAILNSVNHLAYLIQKKHVLSKTNIPAKNLSLNQAFLHDDVSYKQYIEGWERLIEISMKDFLPKKATKLRK